MLIFLKREKTYVNTIRSKKGAISKNNIGLKVVKKKSKIEKFREVE